MTGVAQTDSPECTGQNALAEMPGSCAQSQLGLGLDCRKRDFDEQSVQGVRCYSVTINSKPHCVLRYREMEGIERGGL